MSEQHFHHMLNIAQTALFSPGDRPDRVRKSLAGDADLVIADLEDAVAADAKADARVNVTDIVEDDAAFTDRPGMVVRISEPHSPAGEADLAALAGLSDPARARLAVMIAKTQSPHDVAAVFAQLGEDVPVIALIESARGVLNAVEIAEHASVVRLALGGIDLAADLGCDVDSATTAHARAQLVLASAAAGLAGPIASPCPNFRDPEVVADAARSARSNGLSGILCIHPAQLEPATQAFAPSEEDVAWARKVVEAADGATALDGQMIDRPVILKAQAVLAAVGQTERH